MTHRNAGSPSPPSPDAGDEAARGGVVTRIEAQRRRRDRVNVFLDDVYAFSLALEVAAPLAIGQELDVADVTRLREEDVYREALTRALGWLSPRPRSREEVRRYLSRREVPPEVAERVMVRLGELGLVDDEAFAAWWVASRTRHKPRGARALRHELGTKGVSRSVQSDAVAQVDELALARQVALKHARRYEGQPRPLFDRRLGGLLARRGFAHGAIRPALEAAWNSLAADRPPEGA